MSDEDVEVTVEDVKAIAQRALAKVNEQERRIDELEEALEDAKTDLTQYSLRLSEYDDDRSYNQYSRHDKVGLVREHAFRKATSGTGHARLDYNDIQWEVFNGEPSADHCYTLMRLAADVSGFEYRSPSSGNRHLAVDADEARTEAPGFSSANKTTSDGGRP